MIRRGVLLGGILAGAFTAASALSLAAQREDAQIAQGKYLVTRVAMCVNCHRPDLRGGPIELKPLKPVKDWAKKAPALAGLKGMSVPGAVKFLTTAIGADGKPADAPMPRFRLKAADAEAVVAYLKSLKPPKSS